MTQKQQLFCKYLPKFKWVIVNSKGDQLTSPRICIKMKEFINIKNSFISSFSSDVEMVVPEEDLRLFMTDIGF